MTIRDLLTDSYDQDGAVVTVPVASLIRTLAGSCDVPFVDYGHWLHDLMIQKLYDDNMGDLIDIILSEGLTIPLNVNYVDYGDEFVMGNGNHRLILALLCGIEYVDVYVTDRIEHTRSGGYDWDFNEENDDYSEYLKDIYLEVLSLTGER